MAGSWHHSLLLYYTILRFDISHTTLLSYESVELKLNTTTPTPSIHQTKDQIDHRSVYPLY